MEIFFSPISFGFLPSYRYETLQRLQFWKQLVAVAPGKDVILSLSTHLSLTHGAMLLADMHWLWLLQACEILGQAFFGLVEFFLPSLTTASDKQFKLIIRKFAGVCLAIYNSTTFSSSSPLCISTAAGIGERLRKSCQSLKDACN